MCRPHCGLSGFWGGFAVSQTTLVDLISPRQTKSTGRQTGNQSMKIKAGNPQSNLQNLQFSQSVTCDRENHGWCQSCRLETNFDCLRRAPSGSFHFTYFHRTSWLESHFPVKPGVPDTHHDFSYHVHIYPQQSSIVHIKHFKKEYELILRMNINMRNR